MQSERSKSERWNFFIVYSNNMKNVYKNIKECIQRYDSWYD